MDWIYGPTALTPDQEPDHYPTRSLDEIVTEEPTAPEAVA